MRFIDPDPIWPADPEDFRCFTDSVTSERLLEVDQLRSRRVAVLTEILSEITWAFWQSNAAFPAGRLKVLVERG